MFVNFSQVEITIGSDYNKRFRDTAINMFELVGLQHLMCNGTTSYLVL